MFTLPGDASPPKSGCSRREPPLLTNAMKLDDEGSTGAEEISVFHQLSDGNTGNGPGGTAPSDGTLGGHCASAVPMLNSAIHNACADINRMIPSPIGLICRCHSNRATMPRKVLSSDGERCRRQRVRHTQPKTVASSPAMPSPSAASASPAMSPPPTSDVVLMSSGSASRASLRFGKLLTKLASAPPAANHVEVIRLTKPPNDDAYGEGSTTASSTKSVEKP